MRSSIVCCLAIVLVLAVTVDLPALDRGVPLLVTIDDLPLAQGSLYPGADERSVITEALLAALNKHGIEAVAFVTCRNVDSKTDRDLLEKWHNAGHELGNHSYQHLSLPATDAGVYIEDLEACRQELAAFLKPHGAQIRFFRFPMLREGDTEIKYDAVRSYLAESGQQSVPVTLDNSDYAFNRDWVVARQNDDKDALARVTEAYHEDLHLEIRSQRELSDRLFGREVPQILLLHANAIGAAEWDELFSWIKAQGFYFANADEVLADPVFSEAPRWIGLRGPGLWYRVRAVAEDEEATTNIQDLLTKHIRAWNHGDLDTFTSIYAENALLISPSGTIHGRAEALAQYRKRYPDQNSMGTLSLETIELRLNRGLELTLLGSSVPSSIHAATLVARWQISYTNQVERRGLAMIALQPTSQGWKITQEASF